jgi:hypothetical protein
MEKDPFNPNNQNMPSTIVPPEVLNPALMREKLQNEAKAARKPEIPL